MAKLSIDQIEFLKQHGFSELEVFDAGGMATSSWKLEMKKRGFLIAFGTTPCGRKGHTLRTRAGHCIQCSPDKISYLKRHIEDGKVYVAYSTSKRIVKVGTSQVSSRDRIMQLNYYRYGEACDWDMVFSINCKRAGEVESSAHRLLSSYKVPGTYYKGGTYIDCRELFNCSAQTAIKNVNDAVYQITGEKQHSTSISKNRILPVTRETKRQTVGEFADLLGVPFKTLIDQLSAAGVHKNTKNEVISTLDKDKLLHYLRKIHSL